MTFIPSATFLQLFFFFMQIYYFLFTQTFCLFFSRAHKHSVLLHFALLLLLKQVEKLETLFACTAFSHSVRFLFCWLKKLQRLLTFSLTDSLSSTSSLKSHNMCIPTYLTTFSFSSFTLTSPLYHHRQTDLTNLQPTKQHLSLCCTACFYFHLI